MNAKRQSCKTMRWMTLCRPTMSEKIMSLPKAADISTTTGCPAELQLVLRRQAPVIAAPNCRRHQRPITASSFSWQESICRGQRGRSRGRRPLLGRNHYSWRGSALIQAQRPPVPPSTFKEAGIGGARKAKWMLGQLETPPANAACALHQKKAPHCDIQGNYARLHLCGPCGQDWLK